MYALRIKKTSVFINSSIGSRIKGISKLLIKTFSIL